MTSEAFHRTIDGIDAANAADPRREQFDGEDYPKETLYAQRMTAQLEEFAPAADELLRIACRAQHIRRWAIPRDRYPRNRSGYLRWRRDLGHYHGEETARIMTAAGYGEKAVARVRTLLAKRDLARDSDVQTLEDISCLVFIRYYLETFARDQREEKLVSILRKTWRKMSPRARQTALELKLPPQLESLLARATTEG